MSAPGPTTAKVLLRQEIRTRRRAKATQRDRQADGEAIARAVLAALPPGASTVAAYVALPSEPPTDALIDALVGHGIRVLLPVLLPDHDLDWRAVDHDGEHPAPLGPDAIGRAEVIVTPALGVDRTGTRLGQGGGSSEPAAPPNAISSSSAVCGANGASARTSRTRAAICASASARSSWPRRLTTRFSKS